MFGVKICLIAIVQLTFGFTNPGITQGTQASSAYKLTVTGDVPSALRLSLDDLEKMTHYSVSLKEHDGTVNKYEGVPISEVLAKAGLEMADHVRGKALAKYVLAEADDGYQVVFGLGELEPSISGHTVILAYRPDGNLLKPNVGPVRLVVEGDQKQARCIRMLNKLTVKSLR